MDAYHGWNAYQEAAALYGQGRWSEALSILEELAPTFPDNVKIKLGRARCLFHLGHYTESLTLCEELLAFSEDAKALELRKKLLNLVPEATLSLKEALPKEAPDEVPPIKFEALSERPLPDRLGPRETTPVEDIGSTIAAEGKSKLAEVEAVPAGGESGIEEPIEYASEKQIEEGVPGVQDTEWVPTEIGDHESVPVESEAVEEKPVEEGPVVLEALSIEKVEEDTVTAPADEWEPIKARPAEDIPVWDTSLIETPVKEPTVVAEPTPVEKVEEEAVTAPVDEWESAKIEPAEDMPVWNTSLIETPIEEPKVVAEPTPVERIEEGYVGTYRDDGESMKAPLEEDRFLKDVSIGENLFEKGQATFVPVSFEEDATDTHEDVEKAVKDKSIEWIFEEGESVAETSVENKAVELESPGSEMIADSKKDDLDLLNDELFGVTPIKDEFIQDISGEKESAAGEFTEGVPVEKKDAAKASNGKKALPSTPSPLSRQKKKPTLPLIAAGILCAGALLALAYRGGFLNKPPDNTYLSQLLNPASPEQDTSTPPVPQEPAPIQQERGTITQSPEPIPTQEDTSTIPQAQEPLLIEQEAAPVTEPLPPVVTEEPIAPAPVVDQAPAELPVTPPPEETNVEAKPLESESSPFAYKEMTLSGAKQITVIGEVPVSPSLGISGDAPASVTFTEPGAGEDTFKKARTLIRLETGEVFVWIGIAKQSEEEETVLLDTCRLASEEQEWEPLAYTFDLKQEKPFNALDINFAGAFPGATKVDRIAVPADTALTYLLFKIQASGKELQFVMGDMRTALNLSLPQAPADGTAASKAP